MASYPEVRMRRLRTHPGLRNLIQETRLSVEDFVFPLFVHHGTGVKQPIQSMPGQFQFSVDQLSREIAEITDLGIKAVMLFGIPEYKDAKGSASWLDVGVVQKAIQEIKSQSPDMLVIVDLCFCEYTDHGHCGLIHGQDVDNDATLPLLAKQAVSLAKAGADIIAPSGMMDGMVMTIRSGLDEAGYQNLPILSYAVKYSSALYGPFRDAAQGAPQFGDRKTYQMNPANGKEACREAALDIEEGADMLMVKPAQLYLDVIQSISQQHPGVPVAAYQVSGEYAMIKAGAGQGWLDEQALVVESLLSIKRAGANFIVSYFAKEVAKWLA